MDGDSVAGGVDGRGLAAAEVWRAELVLLGGGGSWRMLEARNLGEVNRCGGGY